MKIAACVITHDRLPLSYLTIDSFVERTPAPYALTIVDSGSSPETIRHLSEFIGDDVSAHETEISRWMDNGWVTFLPLGKNVYPGRACNLGWERSLADLPEAEVLVRLDNDIEVQPGWTDTLSAALGDFPDVGQFGLLDMREEGGPRKLLTGPSGTRVDIGWHNVGGPCAVRRELWDLGLRWDERTWPEYGRRRCGEDGAFSRAVKALGWRLAHIFEPVAVHHGHRWDEFPDYYKRTALERGYAPTALREHFEECERRVAAWQT